MAVPLPRWRFTVDDYERMADAGILGEDDRVELLDGEVVEMARIGPPHAGCINLLPPFTCLLAGGVVTVQNPVRLGRYSEPSRAAVLRLRDEFYRRRIPNRRGRTSRHATRGWNRPRTLTPHLGSVERKPRRWREENGE